MGASLKTFYHTLNKKLNYYYYSLFSNSTWRFSNSSLRTIFRSLFLRDPSSADSHLPFQRPSISLNSIFLWEISSIPFLLWCLGYTDRPLWFYNSLGENQYNLWAPEILLWMIGRDQGSSHLQNKYDYGWGRTKWKSCKPC